MAYKNKKIVDEKGMVEGKFRVMGMMENVYRLSLCSPRSYLIGFSLCSENRRGSISSASTDLARSLRRADLISLYILCEERQGPIRSVFRMCSFCHLFNYTIFVKLILF